jgi:hypothetical protein
MKNLGKILACTIILVTGILARYQDNSAQAIQPAVISYSSLPADFQVSLLQKYVQSLTRDKSNDTNRVPIIIHEKVPVPYRVVVHDTLYAPLLFIAMQEVREEKALDNTEQNLDIDSETAPKTLINSSEE